MTAPHATHIVEGYVARLEVALSGLTASRRAELIADVRSHIAESRAAMAEETDALLLAIVDRLGEPAEIARDALERESDRGTGTRWGWIEVGGLLLSIVLWPAGVILVWLSRVWTTREKAIGTAFGALPFVIGFPLFAPLVEPTLGPLLQGLGAPGAPMVMGSLGLLPVAGAAYLATRLWRRESYLTGAATEAAGG